MGLDFKHTCPEIDDAIATASQRLQEAVERAVEDPEEANSIIDDYSKEITAEFEVCRKLNEDMRSAADGQIEQEETLKEECQEELEQVKGALDEAEDRIGELEDQVYYYKRIAEQMERELEQTRNQRDNLQTELNFIR